MRYAGYDGNIRLWNSNGRREVRVLSGHVGNVYSVKFEPDGQHLISTGHDGTLRRWNTATGESRIVKTFDTIPYFSDVHREGGFSGSRWSAAR